MSLRRETWLHLAESLPLGARGRFGHDCGPGEVLLCNHTDKGWSGYCFRCDDKDFKPKPLPSMAERLARQDAERAAEAAVERDPAPPTPCNFAVQEWPLEARVWLYKAALSDADIASLGIYYHEPTRRVVLPVVQNGELIYWQARRIFGDKGSKYLNPVVPRGSVIPQYGQGQCIVLTEDLLSSIRVGQAEEAWCLMGVKLCPEVLTKIMADGRPVLIWLDPDPAGYDGAAKVSRTLSLAGVKHAVVYSPKDPKNHSRAEVRQIIQEALCSVR